MTSHVNFSSVKRWGAETGLRALGYCSQGTFLLAMGIDQEIAKLAETSDDYLFEVSRIKKLILPQGMGESHKVLIQYKGNELPTLQGFSIRNELRFLIPYAPPHRVHILCLPLDMAIREAFYSHA